VPPAGLFHRGRLASVIFKRLHLNELIAVSEREYVELAVRLARDTSFRTDLRRRIEKSRDTVFGDQAPVRALESFLAQVSHA
jgi:predicted O-linked N-acetylglucosamine transferase (SPINDLY family)